MPRGFGDLLFDAGGGFGDGFDVAGEFVDGEDEAESVRAMVELVGLFEGLDGRFDLAELFFCFREGNIAGGEAIFELNGLLEGHGSFFVGASFEVD